ncbi:MAG: hypothetical protein ACRDHL_01175 [Candidatus Promineifilaceae bacterium]
MSEQAWQVANLWLRTDQPTEVAQSDLYAWVVWQFPRKKGGSLCGAVHPPIARHTWYPAVIRRHDRRLLIYAHLGRDFHTPSDAAEWLAGALRSEPAG